MVRGWGEEMGMGMGMGSRLGVEGGDVGDVF